MVADALRQLSRQMEISEVNGDPSVVLAVCKVSGGVWL